MKLENAQTIADRIARHLASYCVRVSLAGSVRRQKPEVKDIEIVCMPRMIARADLFGPAGETSALDAFPWHEYGRVLKGGEKYKQIALTEGINLDLFVVTPPAQFGVILAIRTGPADYSKWLVTPRKYGGALPSDCHVSEGRVLRGDQALEMPEEINFLDFLGLGWIEPKDRMVAK